MKTWDELISTVTCGNILWRLVSKTHCTYWTKCFSRMMSSWSPAGKIDHFCTTKSFFMCGDRPSQVYKRDKVICVFVWKKPSFVWPGPCINEIIFRWYTFILFWDTLTVMHILNLSHLIYQAFIWHVIHNSLHSSLIWTDVTLKLVQIVHMGIKGGVLKSEIIMTSTMKNFTGPAPALKRGIIQTRVCFLALML